MRKETAPGQFGKGGKKKGARLADQYQKEKVSNYDLLQALGFDDKLIGENRKLGLKEKPAQENWRNYFVVVDDPAARAAKGPNTYEQKPEDAQDVQMYMEDNEDWKFIEITPPPKKEAAATDLVKIADLPPYCQPAFGYTKTLNQIQSIVYPVALK